MSRLHEAASDLFTPGTNSRCCDVNTFKKTATLKENYRMLMEVVWIKRHFSFRVAHEWCNMADDDDLASNCQTIAPLLNGHALLYSLLSLYIGARMLAENHKPELVWVFWSGSIVIL